MIPHSKRVQHLVFVANIKFSSFLDKQGSAGVKLMKEGLVARTAVGFKEVSKINVK